MNAHTTIESAPFDLTAYMMATDIKKIERSAGRLLVVMMDGRAGVGPTVGEALEKAQQPDAINIFVVDF